MSEPTFPLGGPSPGVTLAAAQGMTRRLPIERTEVIPVEIPMADTVYRCAVLVLHSSGLSGIGEAPAVAARDGDLAALCADLRDERPRHPAARAARAEAELDLAARAARVPAVQLLGAVRRREVRCGWLVSSGRPAAVVREVEGAAAAGYRTIKLKATAAGGAYDLERLGAARWAIGRAGRLRVDFNGRLDHDSACRVLPSLGAFRLELVEQPLPASAPPGEWLRVRADSGQQLAADESLADAGLAAELAASGIALAMKLATVGGPAAALALAGRAAGPVLLGSSYETSIGLAAAVHTACAIATEPLDCGLATRRLLGADLAGGLGREGPVLGLPDGPGLGVELDRRALARYRLDR